MSPFRLDRSRRGEDDVWLDQKMLFFVLGAVIGLIGMATDRQWLVYVAIAVLAVGLVLRLLGRRRLRAADDEEAEPADWSRMEGEDSDPTATGGNESR